MTVKNFSKKLLKKLSRVVYYLVPDEFKNRINLHEIYKKEQQINSYNYFKKYFKTSILFKNAYEIRKYVINKATENKEENLYYLEFGVFNGSSINFIIGLPAAFQLPYIETKNSDILPAPVALAFSSEYFIISPRIIWSNHASSLATLVSSTGTSSPTASLISAVS